MQEIAVQRQTCIGTFFGMELGGKNIVACDGRRVAPAVIGFTYAVFDFNLFAVFDPKREAQRQYNSHVLLVKLVKAYINLGVASITILQPRLE